MSNAPHGSRPPRDGDGQLRPAVGQDGGCPVRLVEQDRGLRGAARLGPVGGQRQGLAEDPVPGRDIREPEWPRHVRTGDGSRHEPVAARLPDGDEVVAVRVADGPDGRLERLVRFAQAADGPDDG